MTDQYCEIKLCSKCKCYKSTTEFNKDKGKKDGLNYYCKSCFREWRNSPKQKIKSAKYSKKYRKKPSVKEKMKQSYISWIADPANKKRKRDLENQYKREKRKENLKHRINNSMSMSISRALQSGKHGRSWEDVVGYTLWDLMMHLKSKFKPGMTLDNYGEWHIDHIIPKVYFNYSSFEDPEFQECWALNNLQPLWASENLAKKDTIKVEKKKNKESTSKDRNN